MSKVHGIAAAVLLLFTSAIAQNENASVAVKQQPSDLHYELATKDGRPVFHLGEAIELEESYSADVSKKYLLLSLPQQVKGHPVQVMIEPGRGVIDRVQDDGKRSADPILQTNCFYGHGGGIGSGCSHCDRQWLLTSSPLRIPISVTRQFQITEPGHYSFQAKATNVVVAPLDMQSSAPIALTSNKLDIDVVEDSQWSRETLTAAIDQFNKAEAKYVSHGWDKLSMSQMGHRRYGERGNLEGEMQEAAEKMKLLDTEESLVEIIRRYDGANIGWNYYRYVLYDGIIQSKHSSLSIDLLSERMLQPTFGFPSR